MVWQASTIVVVRGLLAESSQGFTWCIDRGFLDVKAAEGVIDAFCNFAANVGRLRNYFGCRLVLVVVERGGVFIDIDLLDVQEVSHCSCLITAMDVIEGVHDLPSVQGFDLLGDHLLFDKA